METFLGLPLPIWGGIIGSTLTYIITYWRERRKLQDAYRQPQRDAVGKIMAASHELMVTAGDMLDQAGLLGRRTSDDAALAGMRAFERALLGVEEAFAVGKLTIVDAECYEQMQIAYNEYSALRRRTHMPSLKDRHSWVAFMQELNTYTGVLNEESIKLVNIGMERLSPTQTWRNRLKVKVARQRLIARYAHQAPVPDTERDDAKASA